MKSFKKKLALGMALIMAVGMSSCGSSDREVNTSASTAAGDIDADYTEKADFNDMAGQITEVDTKNEEGTGPKYESGKLAGDIEGFCYYFIEELTPELSELFATRFGGVLKTGKRDTQNSELFISEVCTSAEYAEILNTRVLSDTAPDLVRYESWTYPYGIYHNLYEPLDGWLDQESPVWASVKDDIEYFSFKDKHYYFPQYKSPRYCVIYDRKSVAEAGLPDPYDLLQQGKWDWNTFEDMMTKWCAQGPNYEGVGGAQWSALTLANATGTIVLDFSGGVVSNNLRDANVQRTMEWVENLYSKGLIKSGWFHPNECFTREDKRLFEIMGHDWGLKEAQNGMYTATQDPDQCYNYFFVPLPKDPQADKYYFTAESTGFLVPRGAKNVQGAVAYILCSRIYETDPDVIASEKAKKTDSSPKYADKCGNVLGKDDSGKKIKCDYSYKKSGTDDLMVCPECGAERKRVMKNYYPEEMYDLLQDMGDPAKYTPIYDASYGLGDTIQKLFADGPGGEAGAAQAIFDGPFFQGTSFVELRETYYNQVDYELQSYRDALAG